MYWTLMIILWPVTILVFLIIFTVELLLAIALWMFAIVLFFHDLFFWLFWLMFDIVYFLFGWVMWLIMFIPNLLLYYWGLVMAFLFKPLDDVCIWWFEIFDGIADAILAFMLLPTWDPAFGIEMILAMPIQALNFIKVDNLL